MGGAHANPLQTWSNLGKPRTLNKEQLAILQASAEPLQVDERLRAEEGSYEVEINIGPNRICMLEIKPVNDQSNTYPGYDEDFVWLEE